VGPGTFETRGDASTHVSSASDFSQLFTGITSKDEPLTHPLIVNADRSFPVVALGRQLASIRKQALARGREAATVG